MNLQSIITISIVSVCVVVCVVMLIYALIKSIRIRKERFKRFGYHTLANRQALNTLKTKVRVSVKEGRIPSVFEELYNKLTIDSDVKSAKVLNKEVKNYREKKGYYKKHVQKDMNARIYLKGKYSNIN